ncbi:MAG: hypothetical protein OEY29_03945 [Gammaproteobacteria bacterium]|nr:hypothetical protein [Gammaproteobacteria bacterium]
MNKISCLFSYECPKKWDELESTNSASIKFCQHCHHPVHLAKSREEFAAFSAEGKCVAIESEERLYLGMPEENIYESANVSGADKGK